ncbi:MAG: hypothetical protein V7749_00945 [Cocleimonas sp.]
MKNVIKVTMRLIDSVWTISFIDLGGYEIELVGFTRDDPEGYEQERELGKGSLIESDDNKRTVIGAIIDGVAKVVVNPEYIFNYGA